VSEQLDLDVRILSTCDVYDALISERVYREA
jgi:HD-GYP domain-containing protein (c-di-GMP phosphodiesterase class II)